VWRVELRGFEPLTFSRRRLDLRWAHVLRRVILGASRLVADLLLHPRDAPGVRGRNRIRDGASVVAASLLVDVMGSAVTKYTFGG
jgi:hypothetical protein